MADILTTLLGMQDWERKRWEGGGMPALISTIRNSLNLQTFSFKFSTFYTRMHQRGVMLLEKSCVKVSLVDNGDNTIFEAMFG